MKTVKQLVALLIGIFLVLVIAVVGCGSSGYQVARDTVNGQLVTSSWQYMVFKRCFTMFPFVDSLSKLLNNQTYLVLLQNNTELRPSGGFLGSYARIETAPTGIKNITVQDIYVPDGQLVGHVDPPLPIQQAFGQGWWKLRDSNWDPDFRIAGEQITWFFDQGGEKTDGLVAVNLTLVNSLLEIFGPLKLADYPESINSDNFYSLAQKYAEIGFFPGSTQKKDFLGAVGRALILKTQQAKPKQLLALTKILFTQLETKQMLIWFQDPALEKIATDRRWDGSLGEPSGNYLYIVETNLGANKANCCITRDVTQKITMNNEQLTINWNNANPYSNPVKPYFWGGDYVNYVRIIVPRGSEIQRVKVNNKELINKPLDNQYGLQEDRYQVEDRGKFKIIGFWAKVPAGKTVQATLNYELRTTNSILVRRQPGIDGFDYKLVVDGKMIVDEKIATDVNIGPWTK